MLVLVTPVLPLGCVRTGGDPDSASAPPGAAVSQSSTQPPAPPEPPLVMVDRGSYAARRSGQSIELDIVATFTNRTAETVYLHPCGQSQPSFMLEKWDGRAWRAAYTPACPMLLMLDPPRVAPGASRTDTARVRASLAPNTMPRFSIDPITGTYRLVYAQAYRTWPSGGPGELLPEAQRVSAAFRIEEG